MKDYKEMADSVYEAVREEKFRKAKRVNIIRKAVPCCVLCCGIFGAVIAVNSVGRDVNLNPNNYQVPSENLTEYLSGEETQEFAKIEQEKTDTSDTELCGLPTAIEETGICSGVPTAPEEMNPEETGICSGVPTAPKEMNPEETGICSGVPTAPKEMNPEESTKEYVQIGWGYDAEGNEYPVTVEKDDEHSGDKDLISFGITPLDTDIILNALKNEEGGRGIIDENGVKTISWTEKYVNVYVQCGMGEEIYALEGGTVTETGYLGGRGYAVTVENAEGEIIMYNHLSEIKVNVGDTVVKNQVVGLAGNSGIICHVGTVYVKVESAADVQEYDDLD